MPANPALTVQLNAPESPSPAHPRKHETAACHPARPLLALQVGREISQELPVNNDVLCLRGAWSELPKAPVGVCRASAFLSPLSLVSAGNSRHDSCCSGCRTHPNKLPRNIHGAYPGRALELAILSAGPVLRRALQKAMRETRPIASEAAQSGPIKHPTAYARMRTCCISRA